MDWLSVNNNLRNIIKMSTFVADMRNAGGKKAIVDSLNKHYNRLNTVKSTLNTRDIPAQHVNKNLRPKSSQKQLEEVKETFRRVTNVKNSKSTLKAPDTYHLSGQLSKNRASKKNTQISEHENNVKSMQKRISRIGSFSERKKNPNDPITNPVYVFRDRNSQDGVFYHEKSIQMMIKPPNIGDAYNDVIDHKSSSTLQTPVLNIPYVSPTEPEPILALKGQMLQIVVKHRILNSNDLEEFVHKTRLRNAHLDETVLEEAINFVINQVIS